MWAIKVAPERLRRRVSRRGPGEKLESDRGVVACAPALARALLLASSVTRVRWRVEEKTVSDPRGVQVERSGASGVHGRPAAGTGAAGRWAGVLERLLANDRRAQLELARLVTGYLAHWRAYDF